MKPTDVVFTDFGHVTLSPRTVAYLDGIAADWRTLANKKPRSKRDKHHKARIEKVISAVMVCAEIAYVTEREFSEF